MPMAGPCCRCCGGQDYGHGVQRASPILSGAHSPAARRAVEAAPSNHLAHFALAQASVLPQGFSGLPNCGGEGHRTQPHGRRPHPLFVPWVTLMTYAGDWERGCALAERAKQLIPHHPRLVLVPICFPQGVPQRRLPRRSQGRTQVQYARFLALQACRSMAAAYGQLGEREAAGKKEPAGSC